MGSMFLHYPDQFDQSMTTFINLLDQKKDMGIFTKVD